MNLLHIQPGQILCLAYGDTSLYAEVIQVVTARQLCWVRPLLLQTCDRNELVPDFDSATASSHLHDLRQSPDLICPASLFRVALDTEVIPLLVELEQAKSTHSAGDRPTIETSAATALEPQYPAHQLVKELIQQIWQAHPEAFQVS